MLKADIVTFSCVSTHFVTGLYVALYALICNYISVHPFPLWTLGRSISAEKNCITGHKNHNQNLAAIGNRGLSGRLLFREKPQAELSACALCSCWLSPPL